MLADVQQHLLQHIASFIGVAALTLRHQLGLRTVLLISTALSLIYHATTPHGPMWDDLFWNAVTLLTNLVVLVQLVLDRTHIGHTSEENQLFQALGSLSPGEFRALLKMARWETASLPQELTHEGRRLERLYYVLDGEVTLKKAGHSRVIVTPCFIGEVAFVKDRIASATVSVSAGTRYVVWNADRLTRGLQRRQSFRIAVIRLLNADMAAKVARS